MIIIIIIIIINTKSRLGEVLKKKWKTKCGK
jgi:hypothetical protein